MKTAKHLFQFFVVSFLLLATLSYLAHISEATPAGATITGNTTASAGSTVPGNRNDSGGTITTLVMNTVQQDSAWKGYVGNVSGLLTLDDALGNTIYNWQLASVTGKVFASRSSSITWNLINCSVQADVDTEQTALAFASTDSDSINRTFASTNHKSFLVATRNMTSCRFTPTFVADAAQTANAASLFQEILLDDGTSFVYSTIIEASSPNGFDNETRHFQLIVPQSKATSVPTPYYFYIELG